MVATDDARAWARRIVEEALRDAGLHVPAAGGSSLPVDGAIPGEGARGANGARPAGAGRQPASEAAERARRIVAEVVADEKHRLAEEERRLAEEQRLEEERRLVEERRLAEEQRVAEAAAAEAAEVSQRAPESEDGPGTPPTPDVPTASVDLLPSSPTEPAEDDPEAFLPDSYVEDVGPDPLAGPPIDDAPGDDAPGPPPLPVSGVGGWWQRMRARHRRRREMAQWAPDAAPRPRRTGRWLIVTILAVVAIALLFPMAVDALRELVAL